MCQGRKWMNKRKNSSLLFKAHGDYKNDDASLCISPRASRCCSLPPIGRRDHISSSVSIREGLLHFFVYPFQTTKLQCLCQYSLELRTNICQNFQNTSMRRDVRIETCSTSASPSVDCGVLDVRRYAFGVFISIKSIRF